MLVLAIPAAAAAQGYAGPFVPHLGQRITTYFTNEFGRDADSMAVITGVSTDRIRLSYTSGRGISVERRRTLSPPIVRALR